MKYQLGKWFVTGLAAITGLAVLLTPAALMAKGTPQAYECPTTSTNTYVQGGVYQYDLDNPVRLAADNPDKNFRLRNWRIEDRGRRHRHLHDHGPSSDSALPPQIATLFDPVRQPDIEAAGQAFDWNWNPSPRRGGRARTVDNPDLTVVMLRTTDGEELHTPNHSRNLGAPFGKGGAIVLYADETSITLKFTREDSAARGYTMHITDICVDPNLLALYRSLDNADRNSTGPGSDNQPRDLIADYDLPGLTHAQVFATAHGSGTWVAIRDEGTFIDPLSLRDWWRVR